MARAVRFDRYGDTDELYVDDVVVRDPSPDEVVVEVRYSGVNPGELGILSGAMDVGAPSHFPSGIGTEFSGSVVSMGGDVSGIGVGDPVIGFSDSRDAHAERVVLAASNVLPKPPGVAWDTGAVIPIAGATATSALRAVPVAPGETAVVAGAAGGVGFVLAQLLVRAGVTVIGTAASVDHPALAGAAIHPVVYGDGVADRIRAAAPYGVQAYFDTHGQGQADVAISLGVDPRRVDSIIDFEAGERLGIKNVGMYQLSDIRAVVLEVARIVAAGEIVIPVKASFPLDDVQDAYRAITIAPGVGKVVLAMKGGS